jgi:hypothetical protein
MYIVEGYSNDFTISLLARPTGWHIMEDFQREESMAKAARGTWALTSTSLVCSAVTVVTNKNPYSSLKGLPTF